VLLVSQVATQQCVPRQAPDTQSEPAALVAVAPQTVPAATLVAHLPDAQYSEAAHPELSWQVATQRWASAQAFESQALRCARAQPPWPSQVEAAVWDPLTQLSAGPQVAEEPGYWQVPLVGSQLAALHAGSAAAHVKLQQPPPTQRPLAQTSCPRCSEVSLQAPAGIFG
jgi:hypothetical protein